MYVCMRACRVASVCLSERVLDLNGIFCVLNYRLCVPVSEADWPSHNSYPPFAPLLLSSPPLLHTVDDSRSEQSYAN